MIKTRTKPKNRNNMTLKQLREPVKEYKGLKSIVDYIKENFADVLDQFTPELVKEYVGELTKGENRKPLVAVFENKLYNLSNLPLNYLRFGWGKKKKEGKTIEDMQFTVSGDWIIISGFNTDRVYSIKTDISKVYLVEDCKEIIKVEQDYLAEQKAEYEEEVKKKIENFDKNIEDKAQLISDMKKYNLNSPDRRKIDGLKAVDVLRNSKSTNEEVIEAMRTLRYC